MGRRFFNGGERAALWLAADGRCVACGALLKGAWHADHILAYALGGETDVINGQALCPPCNLKKGDGIVLTGGWPEQFALRTWQQEAFLKRRASRPVNFLVVATPGAGKTLFALRCAHQEIQDGESERILVVTPTDHLRKQWAREAAKVGIQLQDDFVNNDGLEMRQYDGLVTTYASLTSNPLVYRAQCAGKRTFVILDEPHHLGDDMKWGKAALLGLEPARSRLLISGTPWRETGGFIPFTQYRDGLAVSDFPYSYSDAIADGACRPVMFPRFDGEMRWESQRGQMAATFLDEIPQDEASRRLRTALNPRSQWLADVLEDAHKQLLEVRRDVAPSAGGLVCCIDQDHARSVAHLLRGITGHDPVLAISGEPDASRRITDFDASSDPWIVAVRMISEGVDIKRLAVGVYASNVISFRSFMQFVGRFVRSQEGAEDLVARVNIPNDPSLARYAGLVSGEVELGLEELVQRLKDAESADDADGSDRTREASTFSPGWSGPAELIGITTIDGEDIPRALYDRAEALARSRGRTSREDFLFVAQILRSAGLDAVSDAPPTARPARSLNTERRQLLGARTYESRKLAARLVEITGRSELYGILGGRVKRICGGVEPRKATVEQLRQSIEVLESWQTSLVAAARDGVALTWIAEWEQGAHDHDYRRSPAHA